MLSSTVRPEVRQAITDGGLSIQRFDQLVKNTRGLSDLEYDAVLPAVTNATIATLLGRFFGGIRHVSPAQRDQLWDLFSTATEVNYALSRSIKDTASRVALAQAVSSVHFPVDPSNRHLVTLYALCQEATKRL